MNAHIINCEQGSPEWFDARLGIPTASQFATVLAKGKGDAESKTRRTYMLKLAGERLTGEPAESYTNQHMERGKEMEGEALAFYAFTNDVELTPVGFIRNGDAGCSPDRLIGSDGLLEIKTALPHILLDRILRGDPPPEHKAQVQGQLWISEREWCDLMIYWPKLPAYIVRVVRDEPYIKALAEEVDRFNIELTRVMDTIRSYEVAE